MTQKALLLATGVTLGASTVLGLLATASTMFLLLAVAIGGGFAGFSLAEGNLPPNFWSSVVFGCAALSLTLAGFVQAMKRNLWVSLPLNLSAVALAIAYPPFDWFAI